MSSVGSAIRDGVAAGDHAHGVAGDRGERVGDRRDRADHAEGGVLDDGQAMVTAKHLAPHEFHAGRPLAEHLELFDLVFQPADLRLDKLHAAEFLGVVDRDPSDVVDRLAPAFHAQPLELLERLRGSGDGVVDAVENTVSARERAGASRAGGDGGRCDAGRGRGG